MIWLELLRSATTGALIVLWLLQRAQLRELRQRVRELAPQHRAEVTFAIELGSIVEGLQPRPRRPEDLPS